MKTDVIVISSSGKRMEDALRETEKYARYRDVSPKTALHLRLLTEEMMGMMRSITGETEGKFWIEDKGNTAQLHLKVETILDFETRDKLLGASTSGKNEATRTLMGKLRAFFDNSEDGSSFVTTYMPEAGSIGIVGDAAWSMEAYRKQFNEYRAQHGEGAEEEWDELEKSVVSHVADEVKVFLEGRVAELIIFKKLA